MEFNKHIKRELNRLAELKCDLCQQKLHGQGEVVSLGGEQYAHEACWNARIVAMRLRGEYVPVSDDTEDDYYEQLGRRYEDDCDEEKRLRQSNI